MRLTLYAHELSSATERVRIALALKGVSYEYVSISELGWDEYEKINPHRLVPALSLGGEIIPQSNAILHYLEERYPSPALLPSHPVLRAQSRAFAQHIACEMHAVDILRVRNFLTESLGVDNVGLQRWSDHWLSDGCLKLEQVLFKRRVEFAFCYGEMPGWADLHLIPHLRKGVSRFNLELKRYPILAEIYDRCIELKPFINN